MHACPRISPSTPELAGRLAVAWTALLFSAFSGCALAPDTRHRDRFHNPLPQLHRIAVLPFFNQSSEPTLDEIAVAEAYYAELQAIPGFEVVPIGVSTLAWREYQISPGVEVNASGQIMTETFQRFAQYIGVDAVVIGAVTDYSPYSPPRLALTTRWYAANPSFHPVPVGYGLPWGTKAEKRIPKRILLETELEVARAQLATQSPPIQTPLSNGPEMLPPNSQVALAVGSGLDRTDLDQNELNRPEIVGSDLAGESFSNDLNSVGEMPLVIGPDGTEQLIDPTSGIATTPLPENWPDPTRLIPEPPNPNGPPDPLPQSGPVLTHTRIYRGDDPDVTEKLADYVYARDDGRLGGWQGYLTRSDDFIRFCCYLHITEMLEMRGGRDQSDLIFRWPISRYWR